MKKKFLEVSWDESHFFVQGVKGPFFLANFSDERKKDFVKIRLNFAMDWDSAKAKALSINSPILWDLEIPEIEPYIHSKNTLIDKQKLLAVKHFTEEIYPQFIEKSVGIVIHKGALFEKEDALDDFISRLALFSREIPDSLPIFLFFDVTGLKPFKALSLLHKNRFLHYVLGLKGASFPYPCFSWETGEGIYGKILGEEKIGVLLSDHPMDDLLEKLRFTPYRVLYKEFANQDWEGLDTIIFDEDSSYVKRILQGFQAAGGRIVSKNGNFGLKDEWSLEEFLEFRGRGI